MVEEDSEGEVGEGAGGDSAEVSCSDPGYTGSDPARARSGGSAGESSGSP